MMNNTSMRGASNGGDQFFPSEASDVFGVLGTGHNVAGLDSLAACQDTEGPSGNPVMQTMKDSQADNHLPQQEQSLFAGSREGPGLDQWACPSPPAIPPLKQEQLAGTLVFGASEWQPVTASSSPSASRRPQRVPSEADLSRPPGPSSLVPPRTCTKSDREKLRRDRLNERFLELGSLLDPSRPPKQDKASILIDSAAVVTKLRAEVEFLKSEHLVLIDETKELTQEKTELREEKAALKQEKEQLEARVRTLMPWLNVDPALLSNMSLAGSPFSLAVPGQGEQEDVGQPQLPPPPLQDPRTQEQQLLLQHPPPEQLPGQLQQLQGQLPHQQAQAPQLQTQERQQRESGHDVVEHPREVGVQAAGSRVADCRQALPQEQQLWSQQQFQTVEAVQQQPCLQLGQPLELCQPSFQAQLEAEYQELPPLVQPTSSGDFTALSQSPGNAIGAGQPSGAVPQGEGGANCESEAGMVEGVLHALTEQVSPPPQQLAPMVWEGVEDHQRHAITKGVRGHDGVDQERQQQEEEPKQQELEQQQEEEKVQQHMDGGWNQQRLGGWQQECRGQERQPRHGPQGPQLWGLKWEQQQHGTHVQMQVHQESQGKQQGRVVQQCGGEDGGKEQHLVQEGDFQHDHQGDEQQRPSTTSSGPAPQTREGQERQQRLLQCGRTEWQEQQHGVPDGVGHNQQGYSEGGEARVGPPTQRQGPPVSVPSLAGQTVVGAGGERDLEASGAETSGALLGVQGEGTSARDGHQASSRQLETELHKQTVVPAPPQRKCRSMTTLRPSSQQGVHGVPELETTPEEREGRKPLPLESQVLEARGQCQGSEGPLQQQQQQQPLQPKHPQNPPACNPKQPQQLERVLEPPQQQQGGQREEAGRRPPPPLQPPQEQQQPQEPERAQPQPPSSSAAPPSLVGMPLHQPAPYFGMPFASPAFVYPGAMGPYPAMGMYPIYPAPGEGGPSSGLPTAMPFHFQPAPYVYGPPGSHPAFPMQVHAMGPPMPPPYPFPLLPQHVPHAQAPYYMLAPLVAPGHGQDQRQPARRVSSSLPRPVPIAPAPRRPLAPSFQSSAPGANSSLKVGGKAFAATVRQGGKGKQKSEIVRTAVTCSLQKAQVSQVIADAPSSALERGYLQATQEARTIGPSMQSQQPGKEKNDCHTTEHVRVEDDGRRGSTLQAQPCDQIVGKGVQADLTTACTERVGGHHPESGLILGNRELESDPTLRPPAA